MSPDTLLRELETLTHDARMRRMAELGSAARTDPRIAATLDVLDGGGFCERLLALQSCYGSRNAARALRALSDPSRILQGRALRLIALLADDAQTIEALRSAPRGQRLTLLRLLRRRHRFGPVDAFLEELAGRDPAALAVLLPFGSGPVIARHLAQARSLGGAIFWRRLTSHHARLAVDALQALLSRAESPDGRLVHEATTVLGALAARAPDLALDLARALVAHLPLSRLNAALDVLGRRRPTAVADLLLASTDDVPVRLDRTAHRLDAPRLRALLERRPASLAQPLVWFRRLPPADRADVFAVAAAGWRDDEGCIAVPLLAHLPGLLRQAEARRHLVLPALATRPAQRLPYAGLVPWEEARAALEPWLNHPDAELRGVALQTLAATVRYERPRLGDLLALFHARRHEQDPVRCSMVGGLADLPRGAWGAAHLEALGEVLSDALSAADLSAGTAGRAERLVVALLPLHPVWATQWLATLVQERGHVHLGDLQDRLREEDVCRLAPALLPVLKAWRTRERQGHVAAVAASLGRRLPAFEGLVDLLEGEVQATRTQWAAEYTLTLLVRHCEARAAALIPRLVKSDPSWVTRPAVYGYLHRRRQDLLTPFLGQKAYSGRFSTGRTRFLLPLQRGFFRWTARQQATFFESVNEVTQRKQDRRDMPSVLSAIAQLAALPAVDVRPLVKLAEDERPAVQEAALRALGKLDAGQGVPTLMEALGDARARVAVYALRSAVLAMPVAHALALLRSVRPTKVTVAKEYVRLLGEMPGEAAFEELRLLEASKLHRDVRVALLRALWGHLERPEAWSILERAVESADAALQNSVVRIPADVLSEGAQRRLVVLLARLLDHPEPLVRHQVLQRCANLPVADPERVLFPALLRAITSPFRDERQAAAAALLATCRAQDGAVLAEAVAGLRADRRALLTLTGTLRTLVASDRRRLGAIVRAVLGALAGDPLTVGLRLGLAAEALTWDEFAEFLQNVTGRGELHADALTAAEMALGAWTGRPAGLDLAKVEAALARSPDERLRRLALAALVGQARLPGGWDRDRLERLCVYREDASALVAAAAQFTLPAEEEATVSPDRA